jgi:3,4-dihydroxy 2-butanone 4-phosphate synthase/GTP cyclohydrolase II
MNGETQTTIERIQTALEQLQAGKLIIVTDDDDREHEGDLVGAASLADESSVNFMIREGRGLVCVALGPARAERLGLDPMVRDNQDPHRTAFTISVDARTTTTGISAAERAQTIAMLAADTADQDSFNRPGHVFPLIARRGGVLARRGHTEAAADLSRLAGLPPVGVICEIIGDDGNMLRGAGLDAFAARHGLVKVSINELVDFRDAVGDVGIQLQAQSVLPTKHGSFSLLVYQSEDPACRDIVLLERALPRRGAAKGGRVCTPSDSDPASPLVRLHSECLTGEVFGSSRCDCGAQLEEALSRIGTEGGALVYLRQEGRGIGLAEKIRAYALQDRGLDTVEANLALGHPPDARRFGAGAAVLRSRGYQRVRLLTNNPDKAAAFARAGISIVRTLPLEIEPTEHSRSYLETKRTKFGHRLTKLRSLKENTYDYP